MASVINDIKYVKTGDGTSSATLGHENGPFQKWETQPNQPENAGYLSAFDQTEHEVFHELVADVVFGGWREHRTPYNVVSFPRGNIYTEEDFSDSYVLTEPVQLQGRKGGKDTVYLDHVIRLGVVFQRFELESTMSNQAAFEYEQAIRGMARKYETQTVIDLVNGGMSSQDLLVKKADGSVDIYNTFLNVRKALVERGNHLSDVDVYCTPDIVNLIMDDGHYISNYGNSSNIAAEEVRNGFATRFLGFDIYESGRLNEMNISGKLPAGKKADLFFIDRTQVILCRMVAKTISMVDAPPNYIGCVFLTALEYFKHYIVNNYSVRYIDTTAE